ncbi:esterase/lipase family protein [Motiliproteus coralliicola]|uniref:esterase/lipase family protein n=1 Tax=Motiliproteus coralliicola TaxID=2283196 RepID=UPI0014021BDF|nr:alpha/beta fold hydrolase [Motiliproteus coralliicola]
MLTNLVRLIEGKHTPSILHSAMETRALIEPLSLVALAPLLSDCPRGDGHPVLVLPGFTASDKETYLLRRFLESLGYRVHGWNLGRNVGPMAGLEKRAVEKVRALEEEYGTRVSLVGWSLGGLFARYVAHQVPELVRTVITLGSPIAFRRDINVLSPALSVILDGIVAHNMADLIDDSSIQHWHRTPPVPTTAIYTRTDGAVHWQATRDPLDHEQAENIHVPGSHSGLTHNALVFSTVANRLAQPRDTWQPFRYQGAASIAYGLCAPFKAVI